MLTVLKRITNIKSQSNVEKKSSGLQTMSQNLQKKFSQGVQYNMKVIIKGDSCCGKTSLFHRLQGKSLGEYSPTEQIQVGNVQWNYKNAEEVVKVEVWDVVDKGKKRPVHAGLKFTEVSASLDAEFLDVYKGTDGVIILFDVTKPWTFSYVQRELPKVPEDVAVLILGNCCDMGHHRKVDDDTVRSYVDDMQRPKGQAQVRYSESSMVNGFGLRYVYKFLSLPFLQLQRKTLRRQLERNAEEIDIALAEIDAFGQSPHSDFKSFQTALTKKRRENAEILGTGSNPTRTPSVIFGLGHPINRYRPFAKSEIPRCEVNSIAQESSELRATVEEFVPDGGQLDDNFFRETSFKVYSSQSPKQSDSESEEAINPLVADFQEDIDPGVYSAALSPGSHFNIVGSDKVRDPAVQLDGKYAVRLIGAVSPTSVVTTDSGDRHLGSLSVDGIHGIPSNVLLEEDSREKTRRSPKSAKGKSHEKRLNNNSPTPTGGSKVKKTKKVKDDGFSSKKKMRSRQPLTSGSLKDLEEFFAF